MQEDFTLIEEEEVAGVGEVRERLTLPDQLMRVLVIGLGMAYSYLLFS